MQNGPTDLDPDHARIGRRGSRGGISQWLDHQQHEGRPHRPACTTVPLCAPDHAIPKGAGQSTHTTPQHRRPARQAELSATIRALRSSGHRRRPVGPSRISIRETPFDPHLHPVLVLVLHGKPPANSVAGRHARYSIRPKPRGWRTAYAKVPLRSSFPQTDLRD